MAAFLAELEETAGRFRSSSPERDEPERWILAEEDSQYRAAFPGSSSGDQEARAAIVRRFLQTHALVALADVSARYPIELAEAAELLELWCEEGRVVRIGESGHSGESRWAERENLTEMRRATVAVRRRETLAVLPEVFADFLLRRQHVHPASAVRRTEAPSSRCSSSCRATQRRRALWESELLAKANQGLPSGVAGRGPGSSDLVLAGGRDQSG